MKKFLLFLLFNFSILFSLSASHFAGADLTYTCLGGNQYRFRLVFYRDCSGITPSTSLSLNINSVTCGQTGTLTLNQTTVREVSSLCATSIPNSTCNGGTLPGIQEYVYEGTYTFPANCTDWLISYTDCCRNSGITNLTSPGSQNMYIETTLNNLSVSCNNSPVFSTNPVPYLCQNQPFSYNHGAYDSEGDSLVYELIDARGAATTNLGYTGATALQPIVTSPANGLVLNALNGTLQFTPSTQQNAVVVVRVREFRNGVLISTVMRDMQVVVISCVNTPPVQSGPALVAGGTFTSTAGGGTFRVCAGNTLSFNVTATDANAADVLSMTTNYPGTTVTRVGTNPAVFSIVIPTSTSSIGLYNLTLRVEDNACTVFGSNTLAYNLYVQGIDYITASQNPVCVNTAQSVPLSAYVPGGLPAGSSITWSPSTFLSSTAGQNVTATFPANTVFPRVYTATFSNGVCSSQQSVTITGGTLATTVTPASATLCTGSTLQLNANANASNSGAISYSWSPSATLNSVTISNPIATPTASTLYVVTITANGCTATGSSSVTFVSTTSSTITNSGPVCAGQNVTLTSSTADSYRWTGPNGFTSTSQNNVLSNVTSANAGVYNATLTYLGGCSITQSTNVVVNNYTLQVSPNPALVCGTPVQLTTTLFNNGVSVTPSTSTYEVVSTTYVTYPTTGTAVTLSDDQVSAAVPLGFSFGFFGNTYTNVYIGSNGFITFNAASGSGCCSGNAVPTSTIVDFIALAWNDLYPPGAGTVTYATSGSAPNRVFTVSYTGIAHCCGSALGVTGQIRLYEGSNAIEVVTDNVVNDGSTMTQGIGNATGTLGFAVPGRNGVDWSASTQTWRFQVPAVTTYAWSPSAGLSATNISNPTANPATNTTYTVSATVGTCTAITTVQVNILNLPTALGAQTCFNSTATLTASGTSGATFQWFDAPTGGNLLSSSASFTTPNLTANTTYYVNQTVGACVSTRTAVVVTVSDTTPPTFTNCPNGITVSANAAGCVASVTWPAISVTDNCPTGSSQASLATILTNFNAGASTIAASVPTQFTFAMDGTGGVNANNINDGGSDMYDAGNFLNTNLATNINYSDNTIISNATALGTGGQYFTRYANGLFMMAANVSGITSFFTTGNNGADGSGTADGAIFSLTIGGQLYNVFLKRVYGAGDPSINQLIIVPANASASQTFSTDTNNGLHTVSGLGATTRIYYLLFSTTGGVSVTTAQATTVATTFLTQLNPSLNTAPTVTQTQGPVSGSNFSLGNTTVAYTATDASGNTSTCSFIVTVQSGINVTITTNSPQCPGRSIQFLASPGFTSYTWTGPSSYSRTGRAPDIDNILAANAGTYNLVVTNSIGCNASASTTVALSTCAEVCGNGIDDDGDNLIDLADPDCPCRN